MMNNWLRDRNFEYGPYGNQLPPMTTQNTDRRRIHVVDLSDDLYEGTLTAIAMSTPSWFEELQILAERDVIDLVTPPNTPKPEGSTLLVLRLERTSIKANNDWEYGECFGILPEPQWPANDSRFDDFVGGLRSLVGTTIRWQATVSGTQDDPRLGRIIVQYETGSMGDRRIELTREDAPVSRKVSVPRTIA